MAKKAKKKGKKTAARSWRGTGSAKGRSSSISLDSPLPSWAQSADLRIKVKERRLKK